MNTKKQMENTKMSILRAYVRILQVKDESKVTVADLCRKADVSRSTFYSHFADMDQFLTWAEDTAINLHLSAFQNYQYDTNTASSFEAQIECLLDNADIIFGVLDRNNGMGLERLKQISYARISPHWIDESTLSEEQMKLLCAYVLDGSLAFMRQWWRSGFALERSAAKELLENLFKYGAYNYIYTV